jgi:hypothetical protein
LGSAILLRELGFIEAKDLDQAATITGSREEKIMLSTSDQAYCATPRERTCAPASAIRCSPPIPTTPLSTPSQARPMAIW